MADIITMFLYHSMLFIILLLWNRTVCIAHNHSRLSPLSKNLLDDRALLKPLAADATTGVDQEDDARGHSAFLGNLGRVATILAAKGYLLQQPRPETAFKVLRIGKNQDKLPADERLKIWIEYARNYKKSNDEEGWYKPEKVFILLVKTHPVNDVLDWFKAVGLREDADKLRDVLSKDDFPPLRKSMNQRWLDSRTRPEKVFTLLGVGNKPILLDPNVSHWILYCGQFRQKYGDDAVSVKEIVRCMQGTENVHKSLVYGAYLQLIGHRYPTLRLLTNNMRDALYERLVEVENMSPLLAYRFLRWQVGTDVLKLPRSDRRFRAMKDYTLKYASRIDRHEEAIAEYVFEHLTPAKIFNYLKVISTART
uniref:RxLR effector candidate protein n=2 Tax=Hyaloperonospora arabidopsidis (strain Emoy2) TaxID=559515 RepID=A0A090C2Q1_HYAAE|nr:RxLR effector candidate protein [Hyaloperonospora arabidopsidis Emoy2]